MGCVVVTDASFGCSGEATHHIWSVSEVGGWSPVVRSDARQLHLSCGTGATARLVLLSHHRERVLAGPLLSSFCLERRR